MQCLIRPFLKGRLVENKIIKEKQITVAQRRPAVTLATDIRVNNLWQATPGTIATCSSGHEVLVVNQLKVPCIAVWERGEVKTL